MEELLIVLCVGLALIYTVRRLSRSVRRCGGCCCGCTQEGCGQKNLMPQRVANHRGAARR